jgi:hypothetical protein
MPVSLIKESMIYRQLGRMGGFLSFPNLHRDWRNDLPTPKIVPHYCSPTFTEIDFILCKTMEAVFGYGVAWS